MNVFTQLALACLILYSYSLPLAAQQTFNEVAVVAGMVATNSPTPNSKVKTSNPYKGKSAAYYRHHKRLSATFSGYAIELVVSEKPLRRDAELFDQFGNIYYKQLDTGAYAYYILLPSFRKKKAMKTYLMNNVRPRAPQAQLVAYSGGIRKTK